MNKKFLFFGMTSILISFAIPETNAQTPIRTLQQNQGLTISGVIRSVVGNEFILDDGTGQVIVDAGPRWWHQINVNPGEQVTVVGEYDDDDFDAFKITRSDGTVIDIRSPGGPPPWAGQRGKGRR
ncbi:conserved hypothetical protein [Gloeothece citriformis PCC 7424]|uniref:Uncharacterized protein n=1 Tax=Gloeothece citriformis (strain PCC 7424) TaxID=65393 RepID=B7KI51_GLOC7|nr:NirD/YgiW/YdeI family stress tolerance protein [Gloeothece citriformis]ACK73538.1 conserved hypothetical protein [Gloeothece citriformis PCC 7424]